MAAQSPATPYRLLLRGEPIVPYFDSTMAVPHGTGVNLSEEEREEVRCILAPLPWICGGTNADEFDFELR